MELPPGFRFHPTDEELITHYLCRKALDRNLAIRAIAEVDLNKCEPWDLPQKVKTGEREWYFFSARDRKYPTGMRTNRATESGYWKATGKDKDIYRETTVVGMKKTLVFYKGRAPRGEKTNWVMHEFRLEEKFSIHSLPKTIKNEWVICRVHQKTAGGKRTPCSPSIFHPLPSGGLASHVTCFSGTAEEDRKPTQDHVTDNIIVPSTQNTFCAANLDYPDSIFAHDQSLLRMFCDGADMNMGMTAMGSSGEELSPGGISTDMSSVVSNLDMVQSQYEEQDEPLNSGATVDLDCIWNY